MKLILKHNCSATHRTAIGSIILMALGMAAAFCPAPVAAQPAAWLNVSNSNSFWHISSNWSSSSVPSSDADDTVFSQPFTYEVWWDATTGDTFAGPMTVVDSDVTFRNLGSGYTHTPNGLMIGNAALTLDGISLGNTAFDFVIEQNASLTLMNTANVAIPSPDVMDVRGHLQVNTFCFYSGALSPIDQGGSVTVDGFGAVVFTDGILTADGPLFNIGTTGNLAGGVGPGSLVISNGGAVEIPDTSTTTIGNDATVTIDNGTFYFGCCTVASFANVDISSGTIGGTLTNPEFTTVDVADLTYLQNSNISSGNVFLVNNGTLYGDATFNVAQMTNSITGVLETVTGERMQFPGAPTSNNGEINNFGGEFRFGMETLNGVNGFISGRGVFASEGGWLNDGVMAFSGGFADVLGDVENTLTGTIAMAGGSTTTFYDDVAMAGGNPNINAFSGSTAVFFGSYNGGNSGTGTVEAFGDLRPGNSPAVVSFGGDLFLGHTASTEIELAGTNAGAFDQLDVAGDLTINGIMTVSLIEGFTLGSDQEFVIADVDGNASGTFANYDEGDVVGTFNGIALSISYVGGDGNDVVLSTPIILLGDVNQDGAVNLLDVTPFIDLLSSSTFQPEADINEDGLVNLLDVSPFIGILSGG